jgi:hypothetical protein
MFYDTCMRHIEMHLIENSHDIVLAAEAGVEAYSAETCEVCSQEVGDNANAYAFLPFVVCLDDEAEWIVCKQCAEPVL